MVHRGEPRIGSLAGLRYRRRVLKHYPKATRSLGPWWLSREPHMAMGQNPRPAVNIRFNPHENRLKWVVHRKPQNGISLDLTHGHVGPNLVFGLPGFAAFLSADLSKWEARFGWSRRQTERKQANWWFGLVVWCLFGRVAHLFSTKARGRNRNPNQSKPPNCFLGSFQQGLPVRAILTNNLYTRWSSD